MSPREMVLQQALALTPDDQAFVALSLEENLALLVPHEVAEVDGITGEAFLAELERRSEAYRTGAATSREWTLVLEDLERRQARESKM
ncbi:MAG TPA: hypothetical protein VM165_08120 [Planctomycetaceae bacterium]|nr:hypothetical protein [Planctomycetaceae bacterium]